MPTIFLNPKKKYKRIYTDKRDNLNHSSVYNTSTWKELRITYLKENPLCEKCKAKGIVRLAEDVHHIYPISKGYTVNEKQMIGFDSTNLLALCKACHIDIHKEYIEE